MHILPCIVLAIICIALPASADELCDNIKLVGCPSSNPHLYHPDVDYCRFQNVKNPQDVVSLVVNGKNIKKRPKGKKLSLQEFEQELGRAMKNINAETLKTVGQWNIDYTHDSAIILPMMYGFIINDAVIQYNNGKSCRIAKGKNVESSKTNKRKEKNNMKNDKLSDINQLIMMQSNDI